DVTARLWDPSNGTEIRQFYANGQRGSLALLSPDGRYVLTAQDVAAFLWDTNSGSILGYFQVISDVTALAFSPAGHYIMIGEDRPAAHLLDVGTIKEVRDFAFRPVAEINSHGTTYGAAFSPDGRYVLIASQGNTAHLWDVTTGSEVREFTNDSFIKAVAFSPD